VRSKDDEVLDYSTMTGKQAA